MFHTPLAEPLALSRREALRRILVATAVAASANLTSFAAEGAKGIGIDPNLLAKEIPWPRLLTPEEKRTVTALADVIIPADEFGPAASTVGVPDFIDEWVSAPYEQQERERDVIRKGLAWLDGEMRRRHRKVFADTTVEQQVELLAAVTAEGTAERKAALSFFRLFRDRAAGGYYSTPEGWRAIGYLGNTPMQEFAGPSEEVLKHIGLA